MSSAAIDRASSSSSDSSDDEFDGMTAAEILATIPKKPTNIPKSKEGVPLHHRIYISPENQSLIRKSGVSLDKNVFNFTKEEDDLIRENWTAFAKQNKFSGHIFEFLGYDKDGLVQKANPEDLNSRIRRRVMWPFLCRGLDRRYAKTVNYRISHIFHPFFREEQQDYDMEEIRKRMENDETFSQISESMKIPPRFLERNFGNKPPKAVMNLPQDQRIIMLKILHEAAFTTDDNKFLVKNIDWEVFREKCRENQIHPPPKPRTVNETFRKLFFKHEKEVFNHLEPQPTLKQKLTYFHETLQRYSIIPRGWKKRCELPLVRPDILLTVVFEDYSKNEGWRPPAVLQEMAKARKVDIEMVQSRVQVVKEQRKRISEASPKARFHVVVKKRIKIEDLNGSISKEEERLEISEIQSQASISIAPSISGSIDPFTASEDDPLTELEVSSSFVTSSQNETILAAGGAGTPMNNTTLGSLNQTKEAEVSLDMSQDIWSQLVGN